MTNHPLYIGILSGTSIDAIDLALISMTGGEIKLLQCYSHSFPIQLQQQLQALCTPQPNELVAFGLADREFSLVAGEAVQRLLTLSNLTARDITAIGSHGQTVRHHPELSPAFSLQLGCAATLAAHTGIAVVSHFRQKDIALGGQGAPLAPALHQALFQSPSANRAVINLGGIANISWLPQQGEVIGFDCGPANTLLDAWYQQHHTERYDKGGEWARLGIVNQTLLNSCLTDPYFKQKPPKSTGREYFTLHWLQHHLSKQHTLDPKDVQATLVELTAYSIVQALKQFAPAQQVFLCGGGVHNRQLLVRLQQLAAQINWQTTDTLGVDPDWVEAILFAWLAHCHVVGLVGNLTAVTGADRPAILGSYTPAE